MALEYQIDGKEFARLIDEGIEDPSKRNLKHHNITVASKIPKLTVKKLNVKLMSLPTDEEDAQSLKATPFDFEYATMEWLGFRYYGPGLYLPHSIFRDTNLENANLGGWVLDGSDFTGSSLKGGYLKATSLKDAVLKGTILRRANMIGTTLDGVDLDSADFYNALISGTSFCNEEGFSKPSYVANPAKNLHLVRNLYHATIDNPILHPNQVETWKITSRNGDESKLQVLGRYNAFREVQSKP